jgi:exonuclease III
MKKPLILCLSETHLTKTITDKEIRINGYNYEQCPSENTRTGGVIIFIKQRHKYKVNDIKSVSDHMWMLAIEIDIAAEKYFIINLYHSPNKNDFLKFLDDYLDEIADFTGIIVFMGDFNLNLFH